MEFEVERAVKEAIRLAEDVSPAAPSAQIDVLYEIAMADLEGALEAPNPAWLHLRVVQEIDRQIAS